MQRLIRGVCLVLVLAAASCGVARAQHALTWDEVRARFASDNPTLRAGKLGIDQYIGFNVNVLLRLFDRNQGEKLRTQIDIDRNRRMADSARAQVYSDVDSAYATVNSNIILLKPYKEMYLAQAERVRDTVTFAYQHGGASLLDFLDAQKEYRDTELNYLNLVGSYLMAASQMNLAVGREVMP